MREIKFRAWIENDMNSDINPSMKEVKSIHLNSGNIIVGDQYGNHSVSMNNCIIEQYTGLHDDKYEWYHNDIITDGKKKWLIDYNEEYLTWVLTNPNMKGTINLCGINSRLFHRIGNIHENPELLETHA